MESLAKAIVDTFRLLIELFASLSSNSLASNNMGNLSAQDHTLLGNQVILIFNNSMSFLAQLIVEITKQIKITGS
jgi:hypothetical protein